VEIMEVYFIFVYAILGLVLGSFFNVVAYRLSNEESILLPGSYCPICNHDLRWYDLIPLFSYLSTGGKCRYCGKPISFIYPFSELLTATIFVLCYLVFGMNSGIILALIVGSVLVIVTISDFKYLIIPDEVTIYASVIAIIYKIFAVGVINTIWLIGYGILAFLGMWLLKKLGDIMFKAESMGGGDIKLMFFIGLVCGWQGAIAVVVMAAFLALPLAIYQLVKKSDNIVAFGPFLIMSAFILVITNVSISDLLMNLIGL